MGREMNEMRTGPERMFRQPACGGTLTSPGGITSRMLPGIMGKFHGDVRDEGDDVLVAADLPGA